MKKTIAVDIDDVLSRSAETVLAFSNERWGHEHTLEDLTEDLAAMWQVTEEEREERWLEYMASGNFETYGVIEAAKEALEKLKEHYTLIAVTSRRPILMEITEEWLEANYPGIIDKVVCAQIYGVGKKNALHLTKAEILQEIEAEYLIDDQTKHCFGAAGVGVKALLFGGYPWNRDVALPEGVVRCNEWKDVLEYFDAQLR